jgi:hypothetical protein
MAGFGCPPRLFVQLEGLENRLAVRIDAVNSRVDDVYGHVDGLHRRFDRLEVEYQTSRLTALESEG